MRKPIQYNKVLTSITGLAKLSPVTRTPINASPEEVLNEAIDSVNERITLLPTAQQATGDEIRICRLITEIQRLKGTLTNNNSTRYYSKCECDGSKHKGNLYTMDIIVKGNTADCYCFACGYNKLVNLKEIRSLAVSQEPGKAFFISAQ